MALVTSRTQLSQGTLNEDESVTWTSSSGADTTLTGTGLPVVVVNDFFEIRKATSTQNNGLYIATGTPTTSSIPCTKVFGADPTDDGPDTVDWLGDSTIEKSVFIDVQGLGIAIIEQGNVDAAGVTGQAIYSFIMQEFKDDDFLIANAPFPMLAIDSDAGKYIIGQDISGNNNGFNWFDDIGNNAVDIRTRKMLRGAGWDEVDNNGVTTGRYVGVVTLGVFEDVLDTAYYQFGNDTTVDDTRDFTFSDTVNEAVRFFERLPDDTFNQTSGITLEATGQDLPRTDSGDWRVDGFIVGGQITIRDSETSTNDGTFLLKTVGTTTMTVGTAGSTAFPMDVNAQDLTRIDGGSWIDEGFYVGGNLITTSSEGSTADGDNIITAVTDTVVTHAGSAYTPNDDDETIVVGLFDDTLGPDTAMNGSVNNDNEITLRLRVRDGDTNGKTFSQANLASAGRSVLGNFVYAFPLSNGTDLKIDATDTEITTLTPYVKASDKDNTDGVAVGTVEFTSAGVTFAGGDVGKLLTISDGGLNVGMYEIVIFNDPTSVDLDRITVSETTITFEVRPQGMSIEYFSTPQSKSGLSGGPFNFGIVVTGNDGTAQQIFEFIQYKLRTLGDIDSDSDDAVGRTMDGLARFVGDTGEFGTPDGLSFPRNPDGGGSGVFVDGLNASSKNDVVFYDNENLAKTFPETIAITLDFNDIAITIDTTTEYDLFYDRTTRNNVTDFDMTTTAGGTITGTGLPDTAGVEAGSYIRISGLTGGDDPMNGVYQIVTETTPGSNWIVTRYDGTTIVAVTGPVTVDLDINAVDTPDAIIVHTDVKNTESGSTITYTANDTISDSANGFSQFTAGMVIEIEGSTSNDGIFEVATAAAGTITTVEQTISTEGSSSSSIITEAVSGLASASGDLTFSYEFSTNTQGDRETNENTFVKAKAIGSTGAQYVQSTVQTIVSGTPLTIPVAPATERNYV